MRIAFYVEDARYNGILPSHFDGVRMGLQGYGYDFAYIDQSQDGFFLVSPGWERHASLVDFAAAHTGEEIWLLDENGPKIKRNIRIKADWLVVGPSGGYSVAEMTTYTDHARLRGVAASLEPRDALMAAVGWLH